jgi:hypothetical protein
MPLDAPDSLRISGIEAAEFRRRDFWLSLAPQLHIETLAPAALTAPRQDLARLSLRMRKDGYFGECDERLEGVAAAIAGAVARCAHLGLPPVLVWVFDEPWECYRRLAPVISHFLGADYRALPAFWAWHIDPSKHEAGWKPHRDNSRSLAPDGSPLSLTCWIPLSEATPLNGCMYIVPAQLDPNLNQGATKSWSPLTLARALPAKPGEYLIWNQMVLHWGGVSSEFAEKPRMSMALEFQRGDAPAFREPLLDPHVPPTFASRLRLIGMQIRQYTHMYASSDEMLELARMLEGTPALEAR